jgi:ABC-type multidrug transport system fused ATPase/permease subunit
VAIARVLLKQPPIVIFDEGVYLLLKYAIAKISLPDTFFPLNNQFDPATSALDAKSEKYVQEAMNLVMKKRESTVISIAHRLSTIRHCDRIVVVDHGRIVQSGTFDEISTVEGPFRELMKTQLLSDP